MKRTIQRFLSITLALALVLSFAGVSLAVGSEAAVTVQLLLADQAGAAGYAASAEDFGSYPVVSFQGKNGSDQAAASVAELQANGLCVTPPAGFGVDSLYLAADPGFVPNSSVKSLTELAEIDSQTHAVYVPASAFYDGSQTKSNRGESFGQVYIGDAGSYTLFVTFVRLSASTEVRVSYQSGEVALGGDLVDGGNEKILRYASDADQSVPPESGIQALTVSDLLPGVAENAGRRFLGWKLVYANGAAYDVAPGTTLVPYTSAALIAQWGETVSGGESGVIDMGGAPTDVTETPAPHEHSWDAGVVTVQPSCSAEGSVLYTCTVCGEQTTGTLPVTAHTLEHHDAIPATEQSEGSIEYWQCSICGQLFSDADAVNLTSAAASADSFSLTLTRSI